MSLSKRLCKRSSTEVRQSFSERICDDLSEVILQYLLLEDKLRLECVSKQFQRTVFQKHHEFTINLYEREGRIECRLFKRELFDLRSFESLLKKCPNITSIELIGPYSYTNYNEFIALITKYCNHLLEFKCPLNHMSVSAYEEFHNKFGSKLKAIKPSTGFKTFPNLEELDLSCAFNFELIPNSQFKFGKLVKLTMRIMKTPEVMHKLLENSSSLRYLELSFVSLEPPIVKSILKDISKLKDLIHLKVDALLGFLFNPAYSDLLKEIANNCQKLKCIEFELNLHYVKENFGAIPLKQLLSPLKHFKQLKRLFINIFGSEEVFLVVKDFEGLSNLTHLKISFDLTFEFVSEMCKNIFKNIDIYLPNLQYLELTNICGEQESPQIIDILSPHSKLKTIKIKSPSQSFCQTIEEEITRKCPQIKDIYIKYDKTLEQSEESQESEYSEESEDSEEYGVYEEPYCVTS